MKQVLFVCAENSGRSQMAEAIARAYGMMASSAGTTPAEKLNPLVVEAMKEKGIPLLGKPKMLTEEMIKEADLIVTMGCSLEEACPKPLVPLMEKKSVDWKIDDPKGKSIDDVKKIRAQIEEKVLSLSKKSN
jgi:protein-tyrosine-phosphatase